MFLRHPIRESAESPTVAAFLVTVEKEMEDGSHREIKRIIVGGAHNIGVDADGEVYTFTPGEGVITNNLYIPQSLIADVKKFALAIAQQEIAINNLISLQQTNEVANDVEFVAGISYIVSLNEEGEEEGSSLIEYFIRELNLFFNNVGQAFYEEDSHNFDIEPVRVNIPKKLVDAAMQLAELTNQVVVNKNELIVNREFREAFGLEHLPRPGLN
jgi:hypothetical protein